MFKDLGSFYSSNEWKLAREQAILNALNDKGQIIDQYNGQVIYAKYDVIVHHKIELDMTNVNDYNISLNQDNLMVVSHKSHNEIHQRFGFKQQKVYLVVGCTCSGKSSWVREVANKNDIILDVDNIYTAVSNNNKYNKPNSIRNIVLAIRNEMLEQIAMRNFGGNAYVLTTEARALPRQRLMQRINADEVIYLSCTRVEALERLYNDKERQPYINEQEQLINKFFDNLNEEGLF